MIIINTFKGTVYFLYKQSHLNLRLLSVYLTSYRKILF